MYTCFVVYYEQAKRNRSFGLQPDSVNIRCFIFEEKASLVNAAVFQDRFDRRFVVPLRRQSQFFHAGPFRDADNLAEHLGCIAFSSLGRSDAVSAIPHISEEIVPFMA